jgi:hypothetical protein
MSGETGLDGDQILRSLKAMEDDGLLSYVPPFRGRTIIVKKRIEPSAIPLDEKMLAAKKARDEAKLDKMVGYTHSGECRQAQLVRYFGGAGRRCGICDRCRR